MYKALKASKSETGTSAVEFALILPVFLIFVFGIIEAGILLFHWVIITGEVDTIARWGAVRYSPSNLCNSSGKCCDETQTAEQTFEENLKSLIGPNTEVDCSISNGWATANITHTVPLITPLMQGIMDKDPTTPGIIMNRSISIKVER
jgi:hypothetical protein